MNDPTFVRAQFDSAVVMMTWCINACVRYGDRVTALCIYRMFWQKARYLERHFGFAQGGEGVVPQKEMPKLKDKAA